MEINQTNSADDKNPFRPPSNTDVIQSARLGEVQKLRYTLIIFALSILAGVAMSFMFIVTISASGAVISTVGIILIVLSKRNGLWKLALLGGSGPGITLAVFGLIFTNEWSPTDAETPVSLTALAYAAITLPLIIIAFQRVGGIKFPDQQTVDERPKPSTF